MRRTVEKNLEQKFQIKKFLGTRKAKNGSFPTSLLLHLNHAIAQVPGHHMCLHVFFTYIYCT